jgi:sterol 3beta-glucosyltransferase
MEALMQSDLGHKWVEGTSQREQLQTMKALLSQVSEQTVQDTLRGTQGAELVMNGFVAEPLAQTICERYHIPQISVALQPYRATRSGAASLLPLLPQANSVLNRWMGLLAERLIWSVTEEVVAMLRATLGMIPHTSASYRRAARAIPALYAMSTHVVPAVEDANAYTTGYWFLDERAVLPADLEHFIGAGDPPVYIGFGSMSNSDPAGTVHLIAEALAQVGRRGVVARARPRRGCARESQR